MLKANIQISPFVIERLAKYYLYLKAITVSAKNEWISSKDIALALELTSSTVRQDISYLSEYKGISKRGYNIQELIKTLETVIGTTNTCKAVIVGAGNFGKALLLHQEFRNQGFEITAIFDSNKTLAGTAIDNFRIQDIDGIADWIKKDGTLVGIIAVPEEAAQEVADILINAGVRGILNLSTKMIQLPENMAIVNSRIIIDLLKLSVQINILKNKNDNNSIYAEEGRFYGS